MSKQREEHERYVYTEQWDKIRKARLKVAGYKCEVCNKEAPLSVHHRTYERYKKERVEDVVAICNECHYKFHGQYKGKDIEKIINDTKETLKLLSQVGERSIELELPELLYTTRKVYNKLNFVYGSTFGSTWLQDSKDLFEDVNKY